MLFQSQHTNLAIVCGTSAVRAALFVSEGTGFGAKPEVRQIIHVPFETTDDITSDILRKHTISALRRIWDEISPSVRVSRIYMGLSAPFYISKATRISSNRSNVQQPVTRHELDALVDQATQQFKQELLETMPNADDSDILVFNKLLLKTFLNGYRVEDPLHKDGNTLEIHLRFEATTVSLHRDMTQKAAEIFPAAPIQFVSIPVMYFYALSSFYNTDQGFLLVDVDGEVSDILFIANGILERILTIPLGSNLFLREVAELFHIPLPDAAFMVRRYAEQALEENRMQQLVPLISSFQKVWQARLANILEHYAKDQEIPPHILFTGSGILPFYQESFTKDFLQMLSLTNRVSVSVLTPVLLDAHFNKHQFSGPPDMALACLVLLCARGAL